MTMHMYRVLDPTKETMSDAKGDITTLAELLPPLPGDDDYVDVDGGQCCCGEYNCNEEYVHWSSGH